MPTTIYKISAAALWREAERAGAFTGAPVDLADGYIHFSTAGQVAETAARHFAGMADLVLVAVDARALGAALRYEPSRGGALFPHLYGTLPMAAVRWVKPLPLGADGPRVSGAGAVIGLFDRLAAPLLRTLDPEARARAGAQCAQAGAAAARRAGRREAARAGVRPDISQSGRPRGRFRQERRGVDRAVRGSASASSRPAA